MKIIETGTDPKNRLVFLSEKKGSKSSTYTVEKPDVEFKETGIKTKKEAYAIYNEQINCSQ